MHALPRQRSRGPFWLAAVRQQLGVERVEIATAELLEQDMAAVSRRQGGIALVAPHRGRREVAALAVVRQPCAQVAGEIMSVRVADAAAFDLAHLRGVGSLPASRSRSSARGPAGGRSPPAPATGSATGSPLYVF